LKKVYFLGIGGIGMSAIARYLLTKGVMVSGYDKTPTDLTTQLEKEGMPVHFQENLDLIPKDADLVVYTPAVPRNHKELVYFIENGYHVVKRSDILQMISANNFNICVAGTHGKTTISTMIAHILRHSGYGSTAFLGGISVNYKTNFWSSDNNTMVIEADEYDRSFLKLHPDIAVISAMDADHLDIYGDEQSLQDAFVSFGNQVRPGGILISKFGLSRVKEITAAKKLNYSLQNEAADIYASDIRIANGGYIFTIHLKNQDITGVELKIGGMHNVENALVATAIANELEIDAENIKAAMEDFKGVKRRFEYVIAPESQKKGGYVYPVLIDDYAHHPEELRALLKSARSLFPQRLVTVVFQPHLFTRTRDFADGFGEALSIADRVILLPIYPAREEPIEGVSSELLLKNVRTTDKMLLSKEALMEWMTDHKANVNKEFGEVIIMAGAGDIDVLVQPVKSIIEKTW
jgi:UDP-N-acetylmuramate--alanine ligase